MSDDLVGRDEAEGILCRAYWWLWLTIGDETADEEDCDDLVAAARAHPTATMRYLVDDDGDRFYALAEPLSGDGGEGE